MCPYFFGKESESSRKNNKPAIYAERQQQNLFFHNLYIGLKRKEKVGYKAINSCISQSEAQNHAMDEVDVGFSQKSIRSVKDKDVNGAMATKKQNKKGVFDEEKV